MLSEEEETMEDMRQRLKLQLTVGIKVRRLRQSVKQHHDRKELMCVEKLIICAMHAENRITEKVLARLLYSGFDVAFRQPSDYT
eukprot:scaffold407361_cov47-Attheya_sp.AAC.1